MTTTPGMERPFFVSHHVLPWMEVTVFVDDQQALVRLAGEADYNTAGRLAALILAEVHGSESVRVDIAELTFLDSSLLRALLICHTTLAADGIVLTVCRPSAQARRIFELTGSASLLE